MKYFLFISSFVLFISCNNNNNTSSIKVVGQMRDVMWKGELAGKISTDSMNHPTSYGLGPIEYLKGEVLLFEGQTFVSKVIDSSTHEVTQMKSTKAPFFVYTSKSELMELVMPDHRLSLKSTEQFIDSLFIAYDDPLLVRIDGVFEDLTIHSVNLPEGSLVSSPREAHEGLTNYRYDDVSGSIIGFFSRNHKTVFTHHDSYFHAHFISDDRTIMGHVDSVVFDSKKATLKVSK
ncbi:acetolactate decarboxylase [Aestuariivivens sediminicola]|uniref:acetolactate decarboxylase n=1 Tax=Aestuariivivens sediminicola TaxID=2913560 RepID=UPI001F5A8686|nr:acetolactate decarboxylase [Aestuariivivens sediminicola]